MGRKSIIDEVKKRQAELGDSVVIKDAGMTVYTNNGELSKGCQYCKQGIGYPAELGFKCNLDCSFCPIEIPPVENNMTGYDHAKFFEIFQFDPFLSYAYTGGEPLLYFDDMVYIASQVDSGIYQHFYTNGVLLTEEKAKTLYDAGINEIRFNLLATNFSDEIIEKISYCEKIFDLVCVEVPVMQETYNFLVRKGKLKEIVSRGVRQLNLGEMYLTSNKSRANLGDRGTYNYTSLFFRVNNILEESRLLTYDIIKYSIENNIDILINDCSCEAKELQIMKINKYGNIGRQVIWT